MIVEALSSCICNTDKILQSGVVFSIHEAELDRFSVAFSMRIVNWKCRWILAKAEGFYPALTKDVHCGRPSG